MAETDPGPPHVDVAAYVLDRLTTKERRDFEEHLSSCIECNHELEARRAAAALLRVAAEPVALPDSLEARVFEAIAAEPPPPAPRPAPVITLRGSGRWRARWRPAWALGLLAVLALAAGGGAGVDHLLTSGNQPAVQTPLATVTLVAAQTGSQAHGTARVDRTGTGIAIQLTVEGLEPPPAGHFYTCWLVAGDDTLQHQDRVSVGSFTVPGTGTATLRWDTAASLERYPHLGVTLEPDNGSPLHQGPKVLVATA